MITYKVLIKYENNIVSISAETVKHDNANNAEIQIAEALDTETEAWIERMQEVAETMRAKGGK